MKLVVGIDVNTRSIPIGDGDNEFLDANENPPPFETITEQLHTRVDHAEGNEHDPDFGISKDPYVSPLNLMFLLNYQMHVLFTECLNKETHISMLLLIGNCRT